MVARAAVSQAAIERAATKATHDSARLEDREVPPQKPLSAAVIAVLAAKGARS